MTKEYLGYINQAKGLGILLIVLGHILGLKGGWFTDFTSYFKISIFYVISAFLVCYSGKTIYISSKVKSLLIPYFFWSFVCLFLVVLRGVINNDYTNAVKLFVETVSFNGSSTLWFLPSLFFAFLFHNLLKNFKIFRIVILLIIPFIAQYFSPIINEFKIVDFCIAKSLSYWVYCVVLAISKGVVAFWFFEVTFLLIEKYNTFIKNRYSKFVLGLKYIVPIFFVCCIIVSFYLDRSNLNFNRFEFGTYPFLFYFFGIFLSYGILFALYSLNRKLSMLEFCGKYSLFIMCTHLPLFIVHIANTLTSFILPRPNVACFEYYLYCTVVFIVVLLIEIIFLFLWNKIKSNLMKKERFAFLKYI